MPILEEHAIDIHWTDCLKRIEGLEVNKHNRITVHRDIIPIIFIPGIMGTKLRIQNEGEDDPEENLAWDNLFSGSYGTLKNELKSYNAPVPIEYCFEYVARSACQQGAESKVLGE